MMLFETFAAAEIASYRAYLSDMNLSLPTLRYMRRQETSAGRAAVIDAEIERRERDETAALIDAATRTY